MGASINLKVTSDFAQASADLKKFNKNFSADEQAKVQKYLDTYKDKGINNFITRQKRATIAIKATKGPLEAAQVEFRALQREMERLIKKGIDPQDDALKPLIKRYDQLDKELKSTTQATKDTTKSMSLMDGVMLAAGAAALNLAKDGFRALVRYGMDAAEAAADAQEIYGKFDVVFRDLTDASNAAANALAEDFDLAGSTARKLLGDTGDILTGFGFTQTAALDLSEQVNTLAVDLASFTNFSGGAEGASAALTKAMLGEAESVKALGIVIRQDTKEYKDSVAAVMESEGVSKTQAKALVALQIALEQSKNAVGDYARTSESAANVSRRLEESQKALSEAVGTSINEALTPMKAATADIIKNLAEWVNKNRDVNNFLTEFEGGAIDAAVGIDVLGESLKISQARLDQAIKAGKGHTENLQREVDELKTLIAQRARAAALDLQFADARAAADNKAAEAAKKALEAIKGNTDALEELERMRVDALSADEKRLEKLQDEIDRLVILKQAAKETGEEWDAIERLLIADLNEKNEILARTPELINENRTAVVAAGEDWLSIEQAKIDHLIWIDGLETEIHEHRMSEAEAQAAAAEELMQKKIDAVFSFANAASSIFSALGDLSAAENAAELQRLEEQGASEEELAQRKKELEREAAIRGKKLALFDVAINTASAIIGFLANPGGFAGIALSALAAVTGGIQAAAINAQPIPTAQTGTASPIIVPESNGRGDNVAVMAGAGEQVSVTPRGESGMTQNISVSLNDQVLIDFVNKNIESGDIRITTDNIQGGIAV